MGKGQRYCQTASRSDWEKGKDIAKQLADKLKELESVNQTAKNNLQQQAETILAVTAAEGSDFTEKLADAAKKIAQLDKKNQELLETVNVKESELTQVKKTALMAEVKEKSGVKTNVLKALLTEEDRLEIVGDKVMVNGSELQDWAKTSQADFYVALFPKTHADIDLPGGGSKVADLPPGGSQGEQIVEKKPVDVFIETDFKVPSFVSVIGS